MSKPIVSVKLDYSEVDKMSQRAVKGLFQMGYDIAAHARKRAPYLTGALSNSIHVAKVGNDAVEVIAGGEFAGKLVNYAWIREEGPNRNPETEHYMQNAAHDVLDRPDWEQHYFGEVSK